MGIWKTKPSLSVLGLAMIANILQTEFARAGDLIEVNRIVAKVNDRIVTWGEIAKAMDRLNFSESERNAERPNSSTGKSIVSFRLLLLPKRVWPSPILISNRNTTND